MMHSRNSWGATPPKKSRPLKSSRVQGVCIHYAGFKINQDRNTIDLLRSIQRGHMNTHGWWDIAYNLAVDLNGEVWELRGLETENGAQGSLTMNRRYVAVCALIGDQDTTPELIEGLQKAVQLSRDRWGHGEIIPHSAVKNTSCPGKILRNVILEGGLEPSSAMLEKMRNKLELRIGDTGTDVARLQKFLQQKEDGIFGLETEARLKAVQHFFMPHLGEADGVANERVMTFVAFAESLK